jgi:predicted enzyme related to lactoylglutathione lyase
MYRAKDPREAAGFYVKVLGMKKVWADRSAKMVGLQFAAVGGRNSNLTPEIVLHNDPSIPNYDFSFLVENVEKLCAQFKKQGYKISKEPFGVRCGKYAILLDPDGNILPIIDLTKFGGKPKYD